MIHFLRLIRPVNLLIIAVTMYSIGGYLDIVYADFNDGKPLIQTFNFFLLVISTVFIAAAGNIINDYFDVRADRINRPNRIIVTKHIKRRWAIVFHWVLNFIAFGIAVHLGLVLETFWYVFIHLLSINFLWFYSMQLKRTLVIGNVVIALLTALVPVLVGIYYQDFFRTVALDSAHPFHLNNYQFFPIYLGFGLGLFAFILNWTREIVKDMEDVEGDLVLKARTIPIVYGLQKSRSIAVFFVLVTMALSIPIIWFWQTGYIDGIALAPLFLSAFSAILTLVILLRPITNNNLRKANLGIKFTMVFGMISPLFWLFQLL
jgi:4-hydroxybenzoate polyprenyltransferase